MTRGGRRSRERSGATLVTASAEELIASPEINTVYICTPTFNHLALAQEVLGRGKALFCEKPLAFNGTDAAIMRDAAKAAGVTHQVGLVMRFSPVIVVMRDLIQRRRVGAADDVRDGGRPVLPDPGALREHVARRRGEGRRGHAAGARDPRRRCADLVLRAGEARARRDAPLLREGGRGGSEQRDPGVRERDRGEPRLDLAQRAAPRDPADG